MDARASDATSYDRLPYLREAFAQTHPDRLASIARLFGLDPAPPECCRVLEIGCAGGDNLAPMAAAYPESHFVGVDRSRRQIELGLELARRVGLENLSLEHRDLTEIGAGDGEFDYVLCHGVYSWVPAPVRERVLEICSENLAPRGVAFVSYNTLPGWHLRGAIREMMLFHSQRFGDPLERVEEARRCVEFMAAATPNRESAHAANLREETRLLAEQDPAYVFHDFLEDDNEPLYFRDFAARAGARGLQVLGDARLARTWIGNLPDAVREFATQAADDPIDVQQYADFVTNCVFRQTLLCHADQKLDPEPTPGRFDRLAVSSELEPRGAAPDLETDAPCAFGLAGGDRGVQTGDRISKAALVELREAWPQAVGFPELFVASCERLGVAPGDDAARVVEVAQHLAGFLLRCHLSDLMGLHAGPLPFVTRSGDRPVACPVARFQAAEGDRVTNRRHVPVSLSETGRRILCWLDGTRDRAALLDALCAAVEAGELARPRPQPGSAEAVPLRERLGATLASLLERLGRGALLVA